MCLSRAERSEEGVRDATGPAPFLIIARHLSYTAITDARLFGECLLEKLRVHVYSQAVSWPQNIPSATCVGPGPHVSFYVKQLPAVVSVLWPRFNTKNDSKPPVADMHANARTCTPGRDARGPVLESKAASTGGAARATRRAPRDTSTRTHLHEAIHIYVPMAPHMAMPRLMPVRMPTHLSTGTDFLRVELRRIIGAAGAGPGSQSDVGQPSIDADRALLLLLREPATLFGLPQVWTCADMCLGRCAGV